MFKTAITIEIESASVAVGLAMADQIEAKLGALIDATAASSGTEGPEVELELVRGLD